MKGNATAMKDVMKLRAHVSLFCPAIRHKVCYEEAQLKATNTQKWGEDVCGSDEKERLELRPILDIEN